MNNPNHALEVNLIIDGITKNISLLEQEPSREAMNGLLRVIESALPGITPQIKPIGVDARVLYFVRKMRTNRAVIKFERLVRRLQGTQTI